MCLKIHLLLGLIITNFLQSDTLQVINSLYLSNVLSESRVTLGVGDQTYNLIGSNKTELTLTTPVTNPSVTLQYGFYGAEVEVKYSY